MVCEITRFRCKFRVCCGPAHDLSAWLLVLAAAVAKDRKAGACWGLLSARYGITEGSAREAYVVATGAPWNSLAHLNSGQW
jgi:hypothetical protein